MSSLRYAVIGMGAIGGFYGAKLARAGREVHFLSHSDYEYVLSHGLHITSCDGDFSLPHINAYGSPDEMPVADVVIVGLKTTNEHLLRTLLPPLLHPGTLVILIQNGIGVEADVQSWFPDLALAAGLAFICSAKTEPGHVHHQCYGSITLGNYSCKDEALFQTVLADFCDAGIDAHEVDYLEARWRKAVWNMPFNGMTVALQTQTNQLLAHPATRQLIYEQMMEVIGAANALGVSALDESFAQKMMQMTDEMVPYSPSMRLDFDFHRPMEIHYLYTRPIAEARAAGFAMPRLEMLERELLFIDARNRS